ncbi:hypothetical protein BpHYR1_007238 [Brachionus plicatilis]|uniref:Uncharacterized protein n=1 Tax=Brachionus plicatilis TaxID=10195 RepID=A0A3M7QZU6_BRAPC|nr:hypothetical protein BpHYR1_007238 [Brachionus plicatilis]
MQETKAIHNVHSFSPLVKFSSRKMMVNCGSVSILDITTKLGGNFYIRCIEIRSIENPIQKH